MVCLPMRAAEQHRGCVNATLGNNGGRVVPLVLLRSAVSRRARPTDTCATFRSMLSWQRRHRGGRGEGSDHIPAGGGAYVRTRISTRGCGGDRTYADDGVAAARPLACAGGPRAGAPQRCPCPAVSPPAEWGLCVTPVHTRCTRTPPPPFPVAARYCGPLCSQSGPRTMIGVWGWRQRGTRGALGGEGRRDDRRAFGTCTVRWGGRERQAAEGGHGRRAAARTGGGTGMVASRPRSPVGLRGAGLASSGRWVSLKDQPATGWPYRVRCGGAAPRRSWCQGRTGGGRVCACGGGGEWAAAPAAAFLPRPARGTRAGHPASQQRAGCGRRRRPTGLAQPVCRHPLAHAS